MATGDRRTERSRKVPHVARVQVRPRPDDEPVEIDAEELEKRQQTQAAIRNAAVEATRRQRAADEAGQPFNTQEILTRGDRLQEHLSRIHAAAIALYGKGEKADDIETLERLYFEDLAADGSLDTDRARRAFAIGHGAAQVKAWKRARETIATAKPSDSALRLDRPMPAKRGPRPIERKGEPGLRETRKAMTVYFPPEVSKGLRAIALEEDTTLQGIVGEAIDLLMRSRGKPPFGAR